LTTLIKCQKEAYKGHNDEYSSGPESFKDKYIHVQGELEQCESNNTNTKHKATKQDSNPTIQP